MLNVTGLKFRFLSCISLIKMAKTKKPHHLILLEDIKEACEKQVYADWILNSEGKRKRVVNFTKLARDLGTTQHYLKKQI